VSEEQENRQIVGESTESNFELTVSPIEPPVRPIWRFLIAAIFIEATDWVSLSFASNVLIKHPIFQDALYRLSGAAILLIGFHFMMRTLDEVENKDVLPELGFPKRRALRELLTGAAISIVLISLAVTAILLFGGYSVQFRLNALVARRLGEVFLLLIVGATYEELSFRGYAFQRLTQAVGPVLSIAIFSLWFGAVHLWNPHSGGIFSWAFFNTIAVGVLLAVAYLRTSALWMPIGMHFGWNFALGTLFGLPVSGLEIFSTFAHGKAFGPKWLTGASYGIEASATGAIVILLGFVPVLLLTRNRVDSRISSPSI
jgi:membrane protease YdiL (CAAX protease family)